MELKQEQVLDLYKTTVDEIHKFYVAHNLRVTWFTSIISALLLATVADFFFIKQQAQITILS